MKERKGMNRIALALFAVVSFLPPAVFAVTFGAANVATGDTWTETSSYGSDMTISIDNGMGPGHANNGSALLTTSERRQQTSISRTKTVKVTSLQGHRIGGLEIEYTQVSVNNVDQTAMFAGRKYGLDINGNHVVSVTYVGSATSPSAAEIAFVKSDNSNVGQVREMRRTFGGATVAIGSSLSAKNPEDLFDVAAGLSVDSFSMTLVGVSGGAGNEVALFDVALSLSGGLKKGKNAASPDAPFSGSSVRMDLRGPLHAGVSNGRIIDFNLTGTATAGGQKESKGKNKKGEEVVGKKGANGGGSRAMNVSASGTASLTASYVYP